MAVRRKRVNLRDKEETEPKGTGWDFTVCEKRGLVQE